MDAIVEHVMESWPLQLSLQTPAGKTQVALSENVIIKHAGVRVDPGGLRPGQRVQVTIHTTNGDQVVTELEILD
jgi:hypothetical protein